MRRRLARALARPLTLVAAGTVIPLASAAPVAADSIVVGGFPVDVSQSPYTVALSSRDRFGGARAGQFCGGAWRSAGPPCSPPPTAWTRRCSAPPGAGERPESHSGAYRAALGQRPGGRRTEGLGEPALRRRHQLRRLRRAQPGRAAPRDLGHRHGRGGRPGVPRGHARHGLRLGTPPAPAATPGACTGRGYGCSPTRSARRRTPGAPTAPTAPRRCCARVRWPAAGTPARATAGAAGRPGRLIGLVSWGRAAAGQAARGSTPASPTSSTRWGGLRPRRAERGAGGWCGPWRGWALPNPQRARRGVREQRLRHPERHPADPGRPARPPRRVPPTFREPSAARAARQPDGAASPRALWRESLVRSRGPAARRAHSAAPPAIRTPVGSGARSDPRRGRARPSHRLARPGAGRTRTPPQRQRERRRAASSARGGRRPFAGLCRTGCSSSDAKCQLSSSGAPFGAVSRSVSSCISAAIFLSSGSNLRPWWAQKSSSPPLSRTTRR